MAGLPNCRLMQPKNPTCPTALTSFCKMSMQNAASLRTATQTGQTLLLNRDTAFVISGLPHIVLLGEQGNEADFAAHVTSRPRRRRTRAGVGSGMLGIWGAGNAEGVKGRVGGGGRSGRHSAGGVNLRGPYRQRRRGQRSRRRHFGSTITTARKTPEGKEGCHFRRSSSLAPAAVTASITKASTAHHQYARYPGNGRTGGRRGRIVSPPPSPLTGLPGGHWSAGGMRRCFMGFCPGVPQPNKKKRPAPSSSC